MIVMKKKNEVGEEVIVLKNTGKHNKQVATMDDQMKNNLIKKISKTVTGFGGFYLILELSALLLFCGQPALAQHDSTTVVHSKPYKFTTVALNRMKERARHVTIYRDAWGIPHVYGTTDADAAFGLAYATAEDQFRMLEPYWYEALGRSAEVDGPKAEKWDVLIHAIRLPYFAKQAYTTASPKIRVLAQAITDGLNYYLVKHPKFHPRLLNHFEPWYVFAFNRAGYDINIQQAGINLRRLMHIVLPHDQKDPKGSNMWAVGPKKSASGHTMLFLSPHVSLNVPYEVQVVSGQGWNMSGTSGYGQILPALGHNTQIGWSLTVNFPGIVGLWMETFNDTKHPLRNRYGKGYKTAIAWTDTIKVMQKDGSLKPVVLHLRRTIHGPILAEQNGHPIAVRMANIRHGRTLAEFYAMSKAQNLKQFREALSIGGLTMHNVMYADKKGNIFYIYNGAVPKRSDKYDWSRPVDGSDPGTMWGPDLPITDLPQVLNPPSGWMQNTNSSPFYTTARDNPDSTQFPAYVVAGSGHYDHQNNRSFESRHLLSQPGKFTFNQWRKMAFSTHFLMADKELPGLISEWKKLGTTNPKRADSLRPMIEGFEHWNHNGSINSPETTWFVLWGYASSPENTPKIPPLLRKALLFGLPPVKPGPWHGIRALEAVKHRLIAKYGTIQVPWGRINRLQRPLLNESEIVKATANNGLLTDYLKGAVSDKRSSIPVPGAEPNVVGDIFSFYAFNTPGSKYMYGLAGSSYVSVVEFGPQIKAYSVIPFGESDDPNSPHYFDQAHLYARGQFKRQWFRLKDVKEHAAFAYHPGDKWGNKTSQ